jgi:hypothetical protein
MEKVRLKYGTYFDAGELISLSWPMTLVILSLLIQMVVFQQNSDKIIHRWVSDFCRTEVMLNVC